MVYIRVYGLATSTWTGLCICVIARRFFSVINDSPKTSASGYRFPRFRTIVLSFPDLLILWLYMCVVTCRFFFVTIQDICIRLSISLFQNDCSNLPNFGLTLYLLFWIWYIFIHLLESWCLVVVMRLVDPLLSLNLVVSALFSRWCALAESSFSSTLLAFGSLGVV